ncbi:MAG: hypothetical protein ACSHYB_15540 [Roseibacillus sp.]
MKVQGPSKKLQAVNAALSKLPPKQRTIEEVRQQVIQHHKEARQEMRRSKIGTREK